MQLKNENITTTMKIIKIKNIRNRNIIIKKRITFVIVVIAFALKKVYKRNNILY